MRESATSCADVQLRATSTRRPRLSSLSMRCLLQVTHHQEPIHRLGIMVSHHRATHHHMVLHLQATMVLLHLDTRHQAILLRVLHRLATRHKVIPHQEAEHRQAILQHRANMAVHQVEDHLMVRRQATTLHQASILPQVEGPRHIMLPLAAIPTPVLLKIRMPDLQMPGTQAAHPAVHHQEATTTTGTAVVMVAGTSHLQLQVGTIENRSPVVTPTGNHRQPTHQLRIHTAMGHLLNNLQAAIHTVVEVGAALIAIAHIDACICAVMSS